MADNGRPMSTGRYVSKDKAGASSRSDAMVTRTRTAVTGRYVSQPERVAAARARVSADKKRGAVTAPWIIELAQQAG
ncbi:hypothetical protein [Pseudokineococcus marinus]|uniref:Uncharacterized protein n=1 Tax=Pseudokineococcus marinus TaxID=351215 RepID=A0A849BQ79_9ACTN|nr:hypothetical protein [Pseudokineococcus marinus]NNH21706.1 hypothetical protein [Pseudokineococcus marinus]